MLFGMLPISVCWLLRGGYYVSRIVSLCSRVSGAVLLIVGFLFVVVR